jgi:hypothetical protein
MKKYLVTEPDDDFNPVTKEYTEQDILNEYGMYWFNLMIEREKPIEKITARNCIDDWVATNWAEEVTDEN